MFSPNRPALRLVTVRTSRRNNSVFPFFPILFYSVQWIFPNNYTKMKGKLIFAVILFCAVAENLAKPTIYKRNEDNIFEPVMVPVSSTVIPLPVYKMEYGFGFISKDKKAQSAFKPSGSIKLITANKSHVKKSD